MYDDNENTVMISSFSPGSFFADRYRIDQLLGAGAMGRVYEATELHSHRRVALKVLHADRMAEVETVTRFKREAEVLASIGHPCIVEVFTFHHTHSGIPYLAMELLEGVTLKTRLQSAGHFQDPRGLQEIVDGIAGALSAAHAHGVIHRDLKPDNIFLLATGTPRAKLVDFGLSRIAKSDKSITHSGMILGTPRYMSPEQIRDASLAGPKGDLYSLGIIIYECLTGKSPYPAEDYGQLLGCLMEGRTIPFETLRPDLPAFHDFMRRAISIDPEGRFASGDELADAFAIAVGSPSRRELIARQTRPRRESSSSGRRAISSQSLVGSKSSTLAFDASAALAAISKLDKGSTGAASNEDIVRELREELSVPPPPPEPLTPEPLPVEPYPVEPYPVEPYPVESSPAAPAPAAPSPVESWATPPQPDALAMRGGVPITAPFVSPSQAPGARAANRGGLPITEPFPQPPPPNPSDFTDETTDAMLHPPSGTAATMEALESVPPPPVSYPPRPSGSLPPPPADAVRAQGGDTMYLANVGLPPPPATPSVAPYASVPAPAPYPSQPTPPKKRRGLGLALFLVALVVVIVLSALGGFGLRAHLRGDIEIPGLSNLLGR